MEKCTYCVQRIRGAEIEAERECDTRPKDENGRPQIKDGEIVTACQAGLPVRGDHLRRPERPGQRRVGAWKARADATTACWPN